MTWFDLTWNIFGLILTWLDLAWNSFELAMTWFDLTWNFIKMTWLDLNQKITDLPISGWDVFGMLLNVCNEIILEDIMVLASNQDCS